MTLYYKGHIESVNMLMDRAQSIGVLNDILEATDNRQAHLQIFPLGAPTHFSFSFNYFLKIRHRGYNILHHAAENLLPRVIRHLLSSQPQLARILNFRTTPLGRAGR